MLSDKLKRFRGEMMGLAILWVVWFHAAPGMGLPDLAGYGGVDVFFFLSGFGLCSSLNRDPSLRSFLTRRAKRILPVYLPFCILWLGVTLIMSRPGLTQSLRMIAGNLTMTGYFADVRVISWYLGGLLLTILLAPVLYVFLKEDSRREKKAGFMIVLALLVCCVFIGKDQMIIFSRIPLFILGMYVCFAGSVFRKADRTLLALSFLGGCCILYSAFRFFPDTLLFYGMYWLPMLLIVPGLCAGTGTLLDKCPAFLKKSLQALGSASFEIFLLDVWAESLIKQFTKGQNTLVWCGSSIAVIMLGLLLRKATGLFQKTDRN